MASIGEIASWMGRVAPLGLSESWDNTGLLMGDPAAEVSRVLTCLTLTQDCAEEAIRENAGLVITHHPLPFKPLQRITTETTSGNILWKLAKAAIAIYSPHTAWDSAAGGINALLASKLNLQHVEPLIPAEPSDFPGQGAGRIGELQEPLSVSDFSRQLQGLIPECRPRGVDCGGRVRRVAIACGSGSSLLSAAAEHGCDIFLTGEATFHGCLEAQAANVSLLLMGHFASERFSLVHLAELLSIEFPKIHAWASNSEKDPVRNFS